MSDVAPAAASETEVRLSLADIENAVKVIDYAAEQGAFKGWEVINQVLMVRQHLASFLAAAQAVADANAPAEDAAADSSSETAAPADTTAPAPAAQ